MSRDGVVEALARGMVVGVPTDTVYGLAVNPSDATAVQRLMSLKGRTHDAPLVVLAASIDQLSTMVELSAEIRAQIELHWPGALTAILPATCLLATGVGNHANGTLGVRVPDHDELRQLLELSGPLGVTSANLSGEPPALSGEQAMAIFGNDVTVYLAGECRGQRSSTVVDFTADPPSVLRPGPVILEA